MRARLWKLICLILVLVLAVAVGVSLYRSKYGLEVTRYQVSCGKLTGPVRVVQLSDLHNSQFGADNQRLIQQVAAEEPDLIFVTGDLLDYHQEDLSIALRCIRDLSEIAPVYLSMGNHEEEYEARYGTDLTAAYTQAGASVLDGNWVDITLQGQSLRLGGGYGYYLPEEYLATHEADEEECAYLREFQDTEACTLFLCHMPACWLVNDGISKWNVDVVFAGHTHGGQIRLPFVGGLYAPDQGYFVGREWGLFPSGDGERTLVLSRGLGSTERIPRLNNVPEIVTVDLLPE